MKKNQTFLLRLIFVSALVFFSACGDSDSGSTPISQPSIMELTVKTQDDLPNCTKKREGDSSYVSTENSVYLCIDESWRYLGEVADNEDALPNCTEKRNGERAFLIEDHVTLMCSGNKWLPYDIYKGIEPEEVTSSSSQKIESSSSSLKSFSSSSIVLATPCKTEKEDNCEYGLLMDARDGQTYKTVAIGSQIWMAQNLNYKTDDSYCYNDVENNCTMYGRFYTWAAAVGKSESECGYERYCTLPSGNIQGVCPDGWHLPSSDEWGALFSAVGDTSTAVKALKSMSGWNNGKNGSDDFGFSALPAGGNEGIYCGVGSTMSFWSSTEDGSYSAYRVYASDSDFKRIKNRKDFGLSVRCLNDNAFAQTEKSSSSETPKSSSSIAMPSSSSMKSSSSSYVPMSFYSTLECGDLWCGPTDSKGRVIIEEYRDDETSGWWYDFNDSDSRGSSRISFPPEIKEDKYGNFYGPLAEAYDGIRASVTFGDKVVDPLSHDSLGFVGFGFNIVSANQEGADISTWKGLCIVYQSSIDFEINLGVENDGKVTGYNNYRAIVPRSTSMSSMEFSWASFEQESGWGIIANKSTVLAKTAAIRLIFKGPAGGYGEFLIQSIGRLGTCK